MRTTSIAPADEPVARRNKASADESCRRVYTYDSDDALSAYIYNIWMAVLTVLPSVERHGTGLFAFIYAYDATQPPTTSWGLYSLAGQSQNSPSTFLYAYVGSQNPNNYAANSGVSCNSTDYDACRYTTSTSDVLVTLTYDRPPPRCNYAETELYYYGYRYYSAELGIWTSRDPKEELGFQLTASYPVVNDNDPVVLLSRVLVKLQADNSGAAELIRGILLQWRLTLPSGAEFDPVFCNYLHNNPVNKIDPFGLEITETKKGETCPTCDSEAEKKLIEEIISKLNGQIAKLPGKAGEIAKMIKILEKMLKDGKTCKIAAEGSACKDYLGDLGDPAKCYNCCMSMQPSKGAGHFACTGACGVLNQ